jgi:hypothetical protein
MGYSRAMLRTRFGRRLEGYVESNIPLNIHPHRKSLASSELQRESGMGRNRHTPRHTPRHNPLQPSLLQGGWEASGVCGGMFSCPIRVREKVVFRAESKKYFSRVREGRPETYPHILPGVVSLRIAIGCAGCIAAKTYTRPYRRARCKRLQSDSLYQGVCLRPHIHRPPEQGPRLTEAWRRRRWLTAMPRTC